MLENHNCPRELTVSLWPTLQEENYISCHEETSSEFLKYLHDNCVEEEEEEGQ